MSIPSMTNRQAVNLVEEWGYVYVRTTGGKITLKHPTAGMIQMRAPGRSADPNGGGTTLREAARQLGVPLADFLKGPKRPPRRPTANFEKVEKLVLPPLNPPPTSTVPANINGNGNGNGPSVKPLWTRGQNHVRVLEFFRAHAGINWKVAIIAERCELTPLQATQAVSVLRNSNLYPDLTKAQQGVYYWRRAGAGLPPAGLHCRCFEPVTDEPTDTGQVLLRGPGGKIFVATELSQVAVAPLRVAFEGEEWQDSAPATVPVKKAPKKKAAPVAKEVVAKKVAKVVTKTAATPVRRREKVAV